LHLRDLFRDGRRYYIEPIADGFRMTSNSRQPYGGRRRRTRVAAVLNGTFSRVEAGDITFVRLRARMNRGYFLSGLLIPAFVTSIIVYMPWGAPTVAALAGTLFALSLAAYRLSAALQATEMIYFVRKVCEDLPQPAIKPLDAAAPDVVLQPTANEDDAEGDLTGMGDDESSDPRYAAFDEQWRKFNARKSVKESDE
jgi:hypothetical protein